MSFAAYLIYFLAAFSLAIFFTPLVRRGALKGGLIAFPRADRWHKNPTALCGGVGIFFAYCIPALYFHSLPYAKGLLLGGGFLFFVGLLDDKFHLTPYAKLFMQVIAGGIAVFSGIVIALPVHLYLSIPLTLLWIVAVTNSMNLLDNIDGLAAGIAAIVSCMLFFLSAFFLHSTFSIFPLLLAGATLGFLPYNFNPAKIFMGDSGSMFLGYSLAVISITGTSKHISGLLITILIPVFILSVPIFDTIFVMVARKLKGRKIFEGGSDHTSHRLVTLGLSTRKTVLLLYAVSIVFSVLAIFFFLSLNVFLIMVTAFLAIVTLMFFGFFLFEVTSEGKKAFAKNLPANSEGETTVLNNRFFHKRRMVEVLLDLGFICIAYYSSYFLRFEGTRLTANLLLLRESLIWIILIKMSMFFLFGLYRGVWRYISITDLITIFKVVSMASIASILFLTFMFRFQEYSRKVFFIDWLILLFLVLGSRILFRVIGEFLSRFGLQGKNVLIYGAGDIGEMVAREIKRNKTLNYNPVGFIDDDPSKHKSEIQGIPVLGSREKIPSLVSQYSIREILIAIPSIESALLDDITYFCKEHGISYRMIKGILDE